MSKAKFDEKIAAQAGHAATISRQEYSEKIQRFLDLKRDPKLKKEPIDYKLLYKYDLVEEMDANGGVMVQTLVKKGTKLRFICREDLYDTINRVHVEMGHSGRDKMYEKLARIYANITKEAITSYLTLCEKCRPLKRPIAEMQNGEEATKSEVIEQPNLIEMPNGISDNFSLLEQPSTSVVSSFPNSIPSSSKPPHKRGRPCRNSIQKISGKRAASSSTLDSGEFSEGCSRRKISAQIVAISQLTTSNQFFGDQKVLIELKRRWFHLREKFKKELRFVLRDNFAYIPKWPHFNELIWLAPHFDEFRDIAHLLEDFVSSKSNESTGRMKGMNIDNSIEMRPHKLDDLLLPQDFEEVLNDRKASTSKEQGDGNCHVFEQQKESQRNITIPLEERLLKQELDEQELREIAKALGIDVDAVQNGQLHMELEDVDTSFLMDKNGCCPSREAIQTIGYMLMNNDNSKNNSCCDDDRGRKDKANSSDGICGCSCTKIETSDDDEGVSQSEKEFGQMIARKLARLDEEERKNIKAKIMQLLERNHRNDSDSKMMK